ncbi:acyl carrier protein [Streptomyces sp. NPDC002851]
MSTDHTMSTDQLPTAAELRARPIKDRADAIEAHICGELKAVLDIPPAHRFSPTRPLHTQGVDAITALRLKRHLETALEIPIDTNTLLRDETVRELSLLLAVKIENEAAAEAAFVTITSHAA